MSVGSYLNNIPHDWAKQSLNQFQLGCLVGLIQKRKFNYGLLSGVACGTTELVKNLTEPLFKKIDNSTAREAINIFTKNSVFISILSGSSFNGLMAGTIFGTLEIFSDIICSTIPFIQKTDFQAAKSTIYTGIILMKNPQLGLMTGGLLISARLVCRFVYPFFVSKIEEYKIFEKIGLGGQFDQLPSGWGLGCLNRIVLVSFSCAQITGFVSTKIIGLTSTFFIIITFLYIETLKERNKSDVNSPERKQIDQQIKIFKNMVL